MTARRAWLVGAVVAWAAAVVCGMWLLLRYKNTPGDPADTRAVWPEGTSLARNAHVPTLVMFAHPKCTCTRASLAELTTLVTEMRGKVDGRVVFMRPSELEPGWERTDTWATASAIPGVAVSVDVDGSEAKRFGARTSGQIVMYAPDGELLYAGGITGSRGHVGDNVGRRRIEAILSAAEVDQHSAPVFGCQLASSQEEDR
jgi:hypothetical protein